MHDHMKEYQGGQTITIPVDLGSIPMFLRGSGVYVTSEDVKHILADTMTQADLLVSADTDTSFVLYDDDGHTEDYKKGVYARTVIDVKAGDRTVIGFDTQGTYESPLKRMTIRLVSRQKGAFWVTVDGEAVPRYLVRDGWEEAESGWYYNLSDRTIWVKYPVPRKKSYEVTISREKFDLIGMGEE
jgi:alpha-glucosidase